MTAAWLGPLPDPHENCPGIQWNCWECNARQCEACDVSPAEYTLCAPCFDFIGKGPAA